MKESKLEKVELKEYNAYELRFLQILIPKVLHDILLIFNYNLQIDKIIMRGDNIIMGHPDDKLEFVDNLKRDTAAGDYLDTMNHAVATFKKLNIPKGKVIWSDELEPVIVRPDSIELNGDDKNE